MVDFLRSNPWCSRDEYLWKMTVGQVRLASFDFSHVEYLPDKKRKGGKKKMSAGQWLMAQGVGDDAKNTNDLGKKIIKK